MASSSSSSSVTLRMKFEVFLSFRGEDTRNNFTDHLYAALVQKGFDTFKDEEKLPKGTEISSELLDAIEESWIAIVVLSKRYAESTWCLKELAKIMDCMEEQGHKVLPIFYNVDPFDVRKQTGDFKKAFDEHEEKFKGDKDLVKWREAFTKIGKLSGWHLQDKNADLCLMLAESMWTDADMSRLTSFTAEGLRKALIHHQTQALYYGNAVVNSTALLEEEKNQKEAALRQLTSQYGLLQVEKNNTARVLENKLDEIANVETRLADLQKEFDNTVKGKDDEIRRLTESLLTQKSEIEAQIYDDFVQQLNKRMAESYRLGYFDARQKDVSVRFYRDPNAYDAQLHVVSTLPEGEIDTLTDDEDSQANMTETVLPLNVLSATGSEPHVTARDQTGVVNLSSGGVAVEKSSVTEDLVSVHSGATDVGANNASVTDMTMTDALVSDAVASGSAATDAVGAEAATASDAARQLPPIDGVLVPSDPDGSKDFEA